MRPWAGAKQRATPYTLGMAPDERLSIAPGLDLPRSELEFLASRSGGPGGQHVNTSSTRVEVWWE